MVRVGLAGYAAAGRHFHTPLLLEAGMELVAVATSNPERRAELAADVPQARAVDDLDAEREKMTAAGASPGPVRELQRDGALLGRFFFVKDPDGYSIEVLQRGGRFG